MRKAVLGLLASTAISTLTFSAASAADLPVRTAPPPIIQAIPIFTWTGFYVGVNAGAGWLDSDQTSVLVGPGPGIPAGLTGTLLFDNNDDARFTGGGQLGYNYQIGSFVLGLETDIQWADTDDRINAVFVPSPGFAPGGTFVPGQFESNAPEWWGSLRARVGFAFDRVLVYGTGGLAYTDDRTGWALGGGVEWALPFTLFGNSAATFGLEGLFLSFDEDDDNGNNAIGTFTPAGGGAQPVVAPLFTNDEAEFWVVRAKLNFKFGTY